MSKNDKLKVVAVVGPTGSGKTELASKIAERYQGVIISADSRQVYKGLDIGTNKEGRPDQYMDKPSRVLGDNNVQQFLVDVVEPGETFTLNDWLALAREEVDKIFEEDKLPVITGGTGLYTTALLEGYQPGEGRFSKKKGSVGFESLVLMPKVEREALYKKSDKRCEKLFDKILAETKKMLDSGVNPDWFIRIGLDYKYAALNLTNEISYNQALDELKKASRNYIRRQLTWWRHHQRVVLVKDKEEAFVQIDKFLLVG